MANKQNTQNEKKVVGGWNVYLDRNGQTVMVDFITKSAYIIRPKNENSFTLYHNRIALAIALGMVLISFMNDWKIPLLASVFFFAILEFRYRRSWLPSLPIVKNFKPEKKIGFVDSLVASNKVSRYVMLFILYLAFGILLVINGYQIQASLTIMVINYCVLVGCIYLASCYLRAIIKIKKN